ncbi:trypsin-like peptidase domain-containing protein [Streptomyces sp. NPDC056987]|uniref:nSTAND1 domain-containing NTPase n=1 Tax=Streptomyces sp. NPDC056987 TaxID=3345988 RepID=UPI00363BE1A3
MAAVRGNDVLEASQVRVYASDGQVAGAGFLIAGDVLCTCAHVVAGALGLPEDGPDEPPDGTVEFDFPLLADRPRARATVESWRTGGADVALLRLGEPAEGARPAPLADGTDVWGHTFRTMGFPAGADHGVWARGTLRAGQGTGWVQMETDEPGPRIVEGFSGAPVWDDTQNGVVGMTVAAHPGQPTAYLLPSADLVDEATLEPRCPFQGLSAFTEDAAEFFHGRDADTERLLAAVRSRALTLVAGPSGCGKSSLVRAGVLRRLRAAGADVTALRPVPGVRPAAVVARALAGVLEPELGEIDRLAKAEELAGLLDAGDGIASALRARVLARSGGSRHVLFVDQFEEYVGAEPDAGRALFGLFADLAGDGLRIVATARPDSLDALNTAGTSALVSEAVQFLAPLAGEGLEQAVTAPVDAVPGLWFEAGLPERIVADAGDEPGRMPLVQFALTELWRRRSRAMLTHAAYDDLGGVAGALVGYADDAYAKLSKTEQDRARRLFVQLARPGDGVTFTRRPTRTTDLAPELVSLARDLARGKLVVLSHTPGDDEHEEIVDLAHEALTVHWSLLRGWLVDSRDFRLRQEQVRADLNRWQSQQREPARLLSGTDLAEAERLLEAHPEPDDISPAEREYIHLSGRHTRRVARLWRNAMTGVGVLSAVALILAFTTYQNLQRAEDQLRAQAAGLLAQAAEERPANDPGTALQLALAAWHAKPTAHTRQALLSQYTRGQYVTGTYPSLWRGSVHSLAASEDGRVLVVESEATAGERSTLTVITGALDGKPRARELADVPDGKLRVAVSPDGRFVAATAGLESVRLWRTDGDGAKRPATLEPGPHEVRGGEVKASLDFSGDGRRLLLAIAPLRGCVTVGEGCSSGLVAVWETPFGDRTEALHRIPLRDGMDDVAFTSDPDSVAVLNSTTDGSVVEVRDLASGSRLYSRRVAADHGAELRAGGEVVVHTDTGRALELDRTPSGTALELGRTPGRSYQVPVGGRLPDATTRYTVEYLNINSADETVLKGLSYQEKILTDARTGRTFRTRIPYSGDASLYGAGVAAVPRKGGGLTVLAAVGSTLVETRAEPVGSERFHSSGVQSEALSPDKRLLARAGNGRLAVLDVSRKRLRSVRVPEPTPGQVERWKLAWTADSRRVVLWDREGRLRWSYAVADLGSRPVALGDAAPDFGRIQGVVGIGGSEIAVISDGARLARIDATDGRMTTRPFSARQGPQEDEGLDDIFVGVQLVARPDHPGQVAVVTTGGSGRGEILLWDLRGPRRVDALRGAPVSSLDQVFNDKPYAATLAFDPAGTHLAVVNTDGQARVWDVAARKQSARSIPWTVDDSLVGLTPDGDVVVSRAGLLYLTDPDSDGSGLSIPAVPGWAYVDGHRLAVDSGAARQNFDLRPEAQFRALCDAAGRDYTDAERELLPDGTPDGPPCS